jgi:ABC-type dipeptide/oligopeptide/nickel transport system permease component
VARLILRVGVAALTLVGVTLLTFAAMAALPGDPLAAFVSPESLQTLGQAERAALERELGLDESLAERYLRWLGSVLAGDLGRSFVSGRPVLEEIGARLIATLELNGAALLLAVGAGVPFGWWTARREGGVADRAGHALLVALYALPFFWLALLLQGLLAVEWGVVPLYGRTPATGETGLAARLHHLALPALCLAVHVLAFYARFARDTARSGWVARHARVARAGGVPDPRVFVRHAVRPSMAALATLAGLIVPSLVSGSILVEHVFRWPGLGSLFVSAVLVRDVPIVAGLTLITGALTVAGNLLADGLGILLDPRRRREARP